MIELAFGESTAGGLKLAKLMKKGESLVGSTAILGDASEELRDADNHRIWSGMTMEGGPKDVEALTLALNTGDISDMNACKQTLDVLYADFPGASDEIWKTNQRVITRIQEARSTLEQIRMWICSSDPVEVCGLYFVCFLMFDVSTPISVVRVPMQVEKNNKIICYRSTGEISPEDFGALIEFEKPIGALQRKAYADIWSDLVRENAPLRAMINGRIIGVPENFYDFALQANMTDGVSTVAQLIGKTLNQIPGIGDRWLFLRIKAMIQSGELIEVSATTGDHPYSGGLKRSSSSYS